LRSQTKCGTSSIQFLSFRVSQLSSNQFHCRAQGKNTTSAQEGFQASAVGTQAQEDPDPEYSVEF